MKLLIASDLHFRECSPFSQSVVSHLKSKAKKAQADALILCGDNAGPNQELSNHEVLFSSLRSDLDIPIAFIVGNHDLWSKQLGYSSWKLLTEIFPKFANKYNLEEDKLFSTDRFACPTTTWSSVF